MVLRHKNIRDVKYLILRFYVRMELTLRGVK